MSGISHLCIERPILATVMSVIVTLLGVFAYVGLPIAQYPEIAPPTVQVTATYPGASAETVGETVAAPLEQEINGVENMLYMESQSTGDGRLTITVSFELGTNLDTAQVLVQNRVAVATPRLPEPVRRLGVTVQKNSPDLMMVIHVTSPDESRDQLYLSNYASTQVRDVLNRIDGVGRVIVFGARDYAMRVWLDPDLLAARRLTASDVVAAIRSQNVQVASGVINQPPVPTDAAYELTVETQGRLADVGAFEDIIVRGGEGGQITRLVDVARIELAALDYSQIGYMDGQQAVPLGIFQRPGSNALETAAELQSTMERLSEDFPTGVGYEIIYNPTDFIAQSIDAVIDTLLEAMVLVVLVVILFLQTWRASIIPIVAIPVSLIGTFAVMALFGISINNLSLFGLVLAIGIVVDDAIIVVENAERHVRAGLSPREAAHRTMNEVSGALIATSLVLVAVFVPAALVGGITGQFFRQFALTIATATVISTFVSLTLSPAMCGVLLKSHRRREVERPSPLTWPFRKFFGGFNRGFDWMSGRYGRLTRRLVRLPLVVFPVYLALVVLGGWQFDRAPTGFIPAQDQGYIITVIQLPPGSSLSRTDAVVTEAARRLESMDGITHTVAFAGFDGATFTNASNAGAIFSVLAPFEERLGQGLTADAVIGASYGVLGSIQEAQIFTISPPPVRGIGNSGGFRMMVQDQRGRGLGALEEAAYGLMAAANQTPGLTGVFTLYNTRTPRIYADLDRVRARMLQVEPTDLFETLEVYLGSAYVNDFNFLGRTFQVTAQADGRFRQSVEAVADLRTRNALGEMVPIGSVAEFRETTGPIRVPRFNLYPAADIQGSPAPGTSTGEALTLMEELAVDVLPYGFTYEWTELAYQERQATGGLAIFLLSVVFVFLVLAAQYESWALPLAIVLIVPMCLLAGVSGLLFRGMPVDILGQVGLIVLVGLAAKNAILIVEFARQGQDEGKDRFTAAAEAAETRLRPILMTSFAFILGVVPLMIATGAAAEMRQPLGTTVFAGMVGVTLFGLLMTPTFYTAVQGAAGWLRGLFWRNVAGSRDSRPQGQGTSGGEPTG